MPGEFFDQVEIAGQPLSRFRSGQARPKDLFTLKSLCECFQVKAGLLEAYHPSYPLINTRDLAPPFDSSLQEYKELPGFSMLALDRTLDYQNEGFQFDLLFPVGSSGGGELQAQTGLKRFLSRLPRRHHSWVEERLAGRPVFDLANYDLVLESLFKMDRAHLIARNSQDHFSLAGVFASFPSDLDREIKRFGLRIGKFRPGDNRLYEANRLFVYRFLMELHGFPIASERRTSAAMFSRILSGRNENFFISVLGNSDRTLTFLSSRGRHRWPLVEKIALVGLKKDQSELNDKLSGGGWFVDRERRVVILRVTYTQHDYNPENIVEDRALSVQEQEVIHPRTGRRLSGLDLLSLRRSRLIGLNDMVRGEYEGEILYQDQEIIHGTSDHLSRLKFLSAWLAKNRRIILSYSPASFARIIQTLDSYLGAKELKEEFEPHREIYEALLSLVLNLRQEYTVLQVSQAIFGSNHEARPLPYHERLEMLTHFLSQKHEMIKYEEAVFKKAMRLCDRVLENPYFVRRYLTPTNQKHTEYEAQVLEVYALVLWLKERMERHYLRHGHPLPGREDPEGRALPAGEAGGGIDGGGPSNLSGAEKHTLT